MPVVVAAVAAAAAAVASAVVSTVAAVVVAATAIAVVVACPLKSRHKTMAELRCAIKFEKRIYVHLSRRTMRHPGRATGKSDIITLQAKTVLEDFSTPMRMVTAHAAISLN
ncbi:hypothetical protein V1478_004618 [Vespula squamosa]|uniref:Secreted protein n=1 Tax=Vespula squamosa TaxID=30214 RepID=A0ABD2BGP6_VESSQ